MPKGATVKRILTVIFILTAAMVCSVGGPRFAAAGPSPAAVAVLPFEIRGEVDLDFLKEGARGILTSRLHWDERVSVVKNDRVDRAAASVQWFTGESLALIVGAKLRVDYVLHGSVAFSGESARIEVGMVETTGETAPLSFTGKTRKGADGVISEINRIATRINRRVFGRPGAAGFRGASSPFMDAGSVDAGKSRVAGDVAVNGPFVSFEPTAPAEGVRRSRTLSIAVGGIDMGDTDGDGTSEIVVISDHTVEIYRWTGDRLVHVEAAAASRFNHHIGVDVADINGNGPAEIFVTALSPDRDEVRSFVLEYDGQGYRPILRDAPWCFRVVRPAAGAPRLLGQKQRRDNGGLFAAPVFRLAAQDGRYAAVEKVLEKGGAVVTGMSVGSMPAASGETIFGLGPKGRIRALSPQAEVLWESGDRYGGGMHYFVRPDPDPTADMGDMAYFPIRLRLADANGDGRTEVIAPANKDAARRLFQRFRSFDNGRMVGLSWDGRRLAPIWTTQPFSGRISDFAVGDADGDGHREMILSLVTKEGDAAFADPESALILYEPTSRPSP